MKFTDVELKGSQDETRRILIEVYTSSPTMDKSGSQPFDITFQARISNNNTTTIDAFRTVLWPKSEALDYQGLTFTDNETGALAERRVIDVQYLPADRLTAASESVIQVPPKNAAESYSVTHSFRLPPEEASAKFQEELEALLKNQLEEMTAQAPEQSFTGDEQVERQLVDVLSDQSEGLIPGHSYTIGLGTEMSSVSWWREGTKEEVFANGSLARHATVEVPLRMELVNMATFRVVD